MVGKTKDGGLNKGWWVKQGMVGKTKDGELNKGWWVIKVDQKPLYTYAV